MRPFFANLFYYFIVKPWLSLIIGVRYVNKDVFKKVDKCIIVANHNSHFDIVSIMTALPYRLRKKTCAVATIDYFGKSKLSIRAMRFFFNAILINRKRKEGELPALEIVGEQVKKGNNIIIFPEGTRGEAGKLGEFKTGVAVLLKENPGIPFVPVYLDGFGRVLPKKKFVILPMITKVRFGSPQLPTSDDVNVMIAEVKNAILSLRDDHEMDRNRFFL